MRRHLWSLLLLALSGGCSVSPVNPPDPFVEPPQPDPMPLPPDNIKPAPAPTGAVSWATVRTLAIGQDEATVRAAMGVKPETDVKQDDGTILVRWPAAHPDGSGRYVVVQFDRGVLLGFAVLPMVAR